jgi:MOSC domain-containing protein YiiM
MDFVARPLTPIPPLKPEAEGSTRRSACRHGAGSRRTGDLNEIITSLRPEVRTAYGLVARSDTAKTYVGVHKAVYVYPSEHDVFWRDEIPDLKMHWGMFGENFTTEGLLEGAVNIGDRFRVGSAEFVVTQPRMPCFKLGIRFGRPEM